VVVRGTPQTPKIVVRYEIHLADPWVPESLHPYHYELGDFGPADTQARRRGCQAASKTTRRAIHTLVGNMRSHQLKPQGACVVVSSLVNVPLITLQRRLSLARIESALAVHTKGRLIIPLVPTCWLGRRGRNTSARKVLSLSSRMGSSVPSRSYRLRIQPGAWLALSR